MKHRRINITPNTTKYHYRMSHRWYLDILDSLRKANSHADINDVVRYLNDTINPMRKITSVSFF